MKFHDKVTGKIIITVDKIGEKLNSDITTKGLADEPDVVLTTLLVNFVLLAKKNGKDPEKLIENNLKNIISLVSQNKGS